MEVKFSKPYTSGNELKYITDLIQNGKQLHGNGEYTKKCHKFLQERYDVKKVLLTTSCTDALEMAAILCNIEPGDEVIVPSYTFVSTANAFVLRGAKIVFADSKEDHPNIDPKSIKELITDKTKVIVPVHYGGVPCDMDEIMKIAQDNKLFVVEDAAQAIESSYKGKQLGTIGHLGVFSFHDTKNISCGEGGALLVNDDQFIDRSEIIWEKGTNRGAFFRGEVDKYGWVDKGSSYLPSELNAAYLFAQLENIEKIQKMRLQIWDYYSDNIVKSNLFQKPDSKFKGNAHLYSLMFKSIETRTSFIKKLKEAGIAAPFHYLPLESSTFINAEPESICKESKLISDTIMRLPLYAGLEIESLDKVITTLNKIND
jgi:dTDP-4-amino-4,6-dideoxygalactose transaminase